jgi:hypothetical protein
MRSCEIESDSLTHDGDKHNIATDCAFPPTSYLYLSLLTNAIRNSAPLGLPLGCCAIRTPPLLPRPIPRHLHSRRRFFRLGSTPLRSGKRHTTAVRALLFHGAHANRADKRIGGGCIAAVGG